MSEETNNSQQYVVSSSPHTHSGASVRNIMLDVIIATIPAMLMSFWFFGFNAFRLIAVCVISCVIIEALCRKAMGRNVGITDLSAVVTGILLAFNLPPGLPSWMAVVGSFFAIVIAKQLFGGIGYNPFNPALIGRVVLLISFTGPMTTWSSWQAGPDMITTATPLGIVKMAFAAGQKVPFCFDSIMIKRFFIGDINGCIGEVSTAALLAGGIYLLMRRCISWHVPVFYAGTVAVFSGILWKINPALNMPPSFHILAGGLVLGAIFMATDMVTTPVTKKGLIIFGIGCGILTMIIRKWGGYPEGVSFAILLMNAVTPLINKATRPRVFGAKKS